MNTTISLLDRQLDALRESFLPTIARSTPIS